MSNAAESAALAGALSGTAAPPEYGAPARASRASPKRQARVASCGTTRPAHCAQAALRLAPAERAAVDELRALGEAAVGRGGAVRAADQPARVLRGDPVHGVALDHRPPGVAVPRVERAIGSARSFPHQRETALATADTWFMLGWVGSRGKFLCAASVERLRFLLDFLRTCSSCAPWRPVRR